MGSNGQLSTRSFFFSLGLCQNPRFQEGFCRQLANVILKCRMLSVRDLHLASGRYIAEREVLFFRSSADTSRAVEYIID
jgi:hypothetical protein